MTAEVLKKSISRYQVNGTKIPQTEDLFFLQESPTPEKTEHLWLYFSNELVKSESSHITANIYSYEEDPAFAEHKIHDQKIKEITFFQKEPTVEEMEALWNSDINSLREEIRKNRGEIYSAGGDGLSKYINDELIWTVDIPGADFWRCEEVIDGVIAYGLDGWNTDVAYADRLPRIAFIDKAGKLLWQCRFDDESGFRMEDERIDAVVDNKDGTFAVISKGDKKYLGIRRYDRYGTLVEFQKILLGEYVVQSGIRYDDGYLLVLSHNRSSEISLVKVNGSGITAAYTYETEDKICSLKDFIEFNGKLYLSLYEVPKPPQETDFVDKLYYVRKYLSENNRNDEHLYSAEFTKCVRENYTAVLLICDADTGLPECVYTAKGSFAGDLSFDDNGNLVWKVQNILAVEYVPEANAYSYRGEYYIYQYTFDKHGSFLRQENTNKIDMFINLF